jgi:hypothetical protein
LATPNKTCDLGYCPLTYFWIAEFTDGSALAQFDPDTGKENKADPDWLPSAEGQPQVPKAEVWKIKTIRRFGWYPFTAQFAEKVESATKQSAIVSFNPHYRITLKEGEKLVAYRSNTVRYGFHSGIVLGRETQYILGKKGGKLKSIMEDGTWEQLSQPSAPR